MYFHDQYCLERAKTSGDCCSTCALFPSNIKRAAWPNANRALGGTCTFIPPERGGGWCSMAQRESPICLISQMRPPTRSSSTSRPSIEERASNIFSSMWGTFLSDNLSKVPQAMPTVCIHDIITFGSDCMRGRGNARVKLAAQVSGKFKLQS